MTSAISIAVVDDHPLFREGVTRSLAESGQFKVVGEGSSQEDALRIARDLKPDIMLIDLSMPGGGLGAIAPIRSLNPDIRIVVLTVSEAAEDVAAALNGGVNGYVLKGIGSRALAEVLTVVAAGETYVTPTLSARLLSHLASDPPASAADPFQSLSKRERDVIDLVARGMSNKEIGLRLDLHEKTVKHHMSRILSKLNANNRTEAALKYRASADSHA
jgi:DNA-binding NarL/FixJ family response regulator